MWACHRRRRAGTIAALSTAVVTVALLPGGETEASSRQQVTITGSTLPGKGTVEFSNTGSTGKPWHQLGLLKLANGATKTDVVNYFAGNSTKNQIGRASCR